MNVINDVLLTDLYELTMLEAWFAEGANEVASFEFFVRLTRTRPTQQHHA